MKVLNRLILIVLAVTAAWTHAAATDFNPAVIYQGSIGENSFNVAINKGVERFRVKTGLPCREVLAPTDISDYVRCVTRCAENGYSPIFILYGNHFPELGAFVRKYPATRFILLDTVLDAPNVLSFVLADHEGSFLAGALAAMTSKTKILGFVSVVDTPFQRRFLCGYTQGARYVDERIRILDGFTGDYAGSWFDGEAAAAIAHDMMDKGADVIFQAAGGAGPAVLEAVSNRGRLGIGVDINQNGLFPGSVLTSMIKQTNKAVFAALILAKQGIWRDNHKRLGLAQDAVDIAFDQHNRHLVDPAMRSRIETIRKDIVLGDIRVHDFAEDEICFRGEEIN